METVFEWKPEPILLEQLITLAQQIGRSPESIIAEAVMLYLQQQSAELSDHQPDPLIGLYSGSPNLATQAEEVLQLEVTKDSGWTWKQPLL